MPRPVVSRRRRSSAVLRSALMRSMRRVTAVTDKQVHELGIDSTPQHSETELRRLGAEFESETRFRDALANHWVVDDRLVTGQNQNAAPMVARELMSLLKEGPDEQQLQLRNH